MALTPQDREQARLRHRALTKERARAIAAGERGEEAKERERQLHNARARARTRRLAACRRKLTWAERIMRRLEFEPNSGCWLWSGSANWAGYGVQQVDARPTMVHRLAYEHFIGPFDPTLRVLHRCDTPACCNPDHLFLGTQADNVADMMAKGRHRAHGKLSADDVTAIRRDLRPDRELAAAFGIGVMAVNKARRGLNYRHVPEPPQARHCRRAVGARNPKSKLTEEIVAQIRRDARPDRVVAAELGIGELAVRRARLRETWKHV